MEDIGKQKELEKLKTRVMLLEEILQEKTNEAEMYRQELIRQKFIIQEDAKVIYRNIPSLDMLKGLELQIIYVEKPKRGKSKEQQAFDRKYKKARLKALERDGYKCVDCGKDEELHVHHKVHKENGGKNDLDNLETLCKWCHAERHKGEPVYNLMRKALL